LLSGTATLLNSILPQSMGANEYIYQSQFLCNFAVSLNGPAPLIALQVAAPYLNPRKYICSY
jgi:hypothetical protein